LQLCPDSYLFYSFIQAHKLFCPEQRCQVVWKIEMINCLGQLLALVFAWQGIKLSCIELITHSSKFENQNTFY